MDEQLQSFVHHAHERGMHTQDIKELLVEAGWSYSDIARALYGNDLVVPRPAVPVSVATRPAGAGVPMTVSPMSGTSQQPLSVVQTLSTRGFEYAIMFVSLLAGALSLATILHTFIDARIAAGSADPYGVQDDTYAFAATVLLVTLPIFITLFLRLKRAELRNPELKKDASRRRMSHFTQFIAFGFGVGYIIYFVYAVLTGVSDGSDVMGAFWHTVATLAIAGSIFAYLWREEHASEKQ